MSTYTSSMVTSLLLSPYWMFAAMVRLKSVGSCGTTARRERRLGRFRRPTSSPPTRTAPDQRLHQHSNNLSTFKTNKKLLNHLRQDRRVSV